MRIIEESWKDFDGNDTISLSLDKDDQYNISELITLLEKAKEKFGDKRILIHHMNADSISGFSRVYLNHGFDEREKFGEENYEEDSICIYG